MNRQCVFDFFAVIGQGRRSVERLCRFNAERWTKSGELIACSGALKACEYVAWLRFYTPLCERGAQ